MQRPQRRPRRGGAGMVLPRGAQPQCPAPRDGQDLRISPAVAFPFPLAFVAEPSYTYLVPFNLPACQLFQPSHYFYGSSLSSCQFIRVGFSRAGWDGTGSSPSCASSMPSFIQPLPLLRLQIYSFCNFSVLKPFPCIFNLSLPIVPLPLLVFVSLFLTTPSIKKTIQLLQSRFLLGVLRKCLKNKVSLQLWDPLWTAPLACHGWRKELGTVPWAGVLPAPSFGTNLP